MRVVLVAAQSLDGFITRHEQPGTAFTSPEDRRWFPACLREFDCCVLGATTYRESRAAILAELPQAQRRRVVLTRDPDDFAADAQPGLLEFTSDAPGAVLARLSAAGLSRCALLGGGEINGLFLDAGFVDEAWITVEPRLFGGGRPLAAGRRDLRLHLLESERLGPDVLLLRYAITRRSEP